jgi:hypothetical protein
VSDFESLIVGREKLTSIFGLFTDLSTRI